MRRHLFIFIGIITSFSSCVQLPDINPNHQDSVIQTTVNVFVPFNEREFTWNVDVNRNGTTDFTFSGFQYEDPNYGTVSISKVEGASFGNMVTQKLVSHQPMCQSIVETNPIQKLNPNFTVNGFSKWGPEGTFYINVQSDDGCENYYDYLGFGAADEYYYFGVKFYEEGQVYFGYISIRQSINQFGGDLLGCPDAYRIMKAGYNTTPNAGLRIPGLIITNQ